MKHVLSVMTVSALMLSSSAALATGTGFLSFFGELTDTTCQVDIGATGNLGTIRLPAVGVNELTKSGDTSGTTVFHVKLSNCNLGTIYKDPVSRVSVFFEPGDTVNESTGRLKNKFGSATNVELRLLDVSDSFEPINLGSDKQVNYRTYVDFNSDGTAVLPYAVEYYATGQTTPGSVYTTVVYSLMYK